MFYATIFAMIAAGFLGLPALPILVFGSLAMLAMAYYFSMNKVLVHAGMAVIMVSFQPLFFSLLGKSVSSVPEWVTWIFSDYLVAGVCAVAMLLSYVIGVLGRTPISSNPEDILTMVKDVEN